MENSVGQLAGNTSSHRIWRLSAPSVRISRSFSGSVVRKPVYILRMVTMSEMASVMVTMAPMPAPIHTMKIGPRAVFGSAFSTTRYGSRMRAAVSDHHMATATAVPSTVPAVKPSTVSPMDTAAWCHSSPEAHSRHRVCTMRLGLLTRKPSDSPSRQLFGVVQAGKLELLRENNGGGVNRSHQRTGTGLIHPTDKGIASVMGLLFVAQIFHISNTPLLSSCTRGRRRRGAPFR